MTKQPTPPDEFCPECMSLKRKPNKECVNHDKYWINQAPTSVTGCTLTLTRLNRLYMDIKRAEELDKANHANHLIEITKDKKKYIVRCVGDYSDMVKGRNTAYEFSEVCKTLKEAEEYVHFAQRCLVLEYKKHGKKASIMCRYLQK